MEASRPRLAGHHGTSLCKSPSPAPYLSMCFRKWAHVRGGVRVTLGRRPRFHVPRVASVCHVTHVPDEVYHDHGALPRPLGGRGEVLEELLHGSRTLLRAGCCVGAGSGDESCFPLRGSLCSLGRGIVARGHEQIVPRERGMARLHHPGGGEPPGHLLVSECYQAYVAPRQRAKQCAAQRTVHWPRRAARVPGSPSWPVCGNTRRPSRLMYPPSLHGP